MPTVALSTKVYSNVQLKLVDKNLKSMLKGLKVETKICRVSSRGWVEIAVSGEDAKVATHYIAEEIGLCPTLLENVAKFSTVRAYVTVFNKRELNVDLGIFSPSILDASIPLQHLQAQLVDGRKTALKNIAELYGFIKNLPLWVKVYAINEENNHVEAVFSERQLALYRSWTKSLLDRLVVLGVSFNRVILALRRTKCNRDVVNIERLGLFEHAIVCKLGTDAAGLIPKIGGKLWNASLSVFNPRQIIEFLECY